MSGFDAAWAKYRCGRDGHLWSKVAPGGPLRCSRCGRIDQARVMEQALHSWQQTAEACERDNARYRGELRARRECLVGAKQTLESVLAYVNNEELPETVYYQRFPLQERIALVEQAIASTDAALTTDTEEAKP